MYLPIILNNSDTFSNSLGHTHIIARNNGESTTFEMLMSPFNQPKHYLYKRFGWDL